jgi:putative flippase GtrA
MQSVSLSDINRREVKRFVKFGIVGTAGMVTHLTLANIFNFGLHYPDAVANAIGFIFAVIQNYLLNYSWTFSDKQSARTKSRLVQAGQFAVVSLVGLGINSLVREIVSYILHPIWLSLIDNHVIAEIVNYNFSIAVAIGVVLFWNFAVNRLWTFRNR